MRAVLFGVILFSCIILRASALLLHAVNYLAFVDCLRRGVGSLRLQPCSEVAVRLTSLLLFHSLYVAWSFAADSTNKFNKAFRRSHHVRCCFSFPLQLPRRRCLVIIARLLFDAAELERFRCSNRQSYKKLCMKTLSILVPLATTYFCESGFSSLLRLKNKVPNRLNPSNDLRMVLCNYV